MSIYKSYDPASGPELQKRFLMEESGESFHTGRTRFRIQCRKCGEVLHTSTNHPPHYIARHDEESPQCGKQS